MLLKRRKRKIVENAQEYLEAGEQIRALVMTQTGQTAGATGRRAAAGAIRPGRAIRDVGAAKRQIDEDRAPGIDPAKADEATRFGRVHALAVTDSNVYSFSIPAWTGIAGVREKESLAEARLELDGKVIRFAGVEYHVLGAAGRDARAVAEWVAGAGAGS